MREIVNAFFSLPVSERVAILVGIAFLLWCFLARPILKIASIAPWLLKKILLLLYMLIEFPVSWLHRIFGGIFGGIDRGLATVTEKICNVLDMLFRKMYKPETIYGGWAFLLCLVIVGYLLIPMKANQTDKFFVFWQNSYLQKEREAYWWLHNQGWM